jgi:ABC-type phosphate transport system substrate-binding protein
VDITKLNLDAATAENEVHSAWEAVQEDVNAISYVGYGFLVRNKFGTKW